VGTANPGRAKDKSQKMKAAVVSIEEKKKKQRNS
jgi:hypothetical protein